MSIPGPDLDLNFRPQSYFWPLNERSHVVSAIKGAERRAYSSAYLRALSVTLNLATRHPSTALGSGRSPGLPCSSLHWLMANLWNKLARLHAFASFYAMRKNAARNFWRGCLWLPP